MIDQLLITCWLALPALAEADIQALNTRYWLIGPGNGVYLNCDSHSMDGTLDCEREYVAIKKAPELGDIIFVPQPGRITHPNAMFLVHRIISITAAGFITKGDANRDSDLDMWGFTVQPHEIAFTVVGEYAN